MKRLVLISVLVLASCGVNAPAGNGPEWACLDKVFELNGSDRLEIEGKTYVFFRKAHQLSILDQTKGQALFTLDGRVTDSESNLKGKLVPSSEDNAQLAQALTKLSLYSFANAHHVEVLYNCTDAGDKKCSGGRNKVREVREVCHDFLAGML